MYQIMPNRVEAPYDRHDLLVTLQNADIEHSPLIPRGGGTSLVGQSIGSGTILDCSRYLNRVLELNIEEGWVRVEPGLVCSELNSYLKPYGYCFAPDPATLNRATIGGMVANNSSGMRSVRYGMSIDHVIGIELALANGDILTLAPLDEGQLSEKCSRNDAEGNIYRGVRELLRLNADEIRQQYPKVLRRSGGYSLDALVDAAEFNLAKLICGSEGTLGVILSATLKLTHLPAKSAVALAHFESVDAALRSVPGIVALGPSAVELLDGTVLRQAREHPSTRDTCSVLAGDPEAVLIIEVQGETQDSVRNDIARIANGLLDCSYACPVMEEPQAMKAVWQLRSSALGLITTVKGPRKPVPYIEDAAIPLDHLADYAAEVAAVCDRHHQPVALFGHASVGLLHIRPLHDLHLTREIDSMKSIQEEVFNLVLKYGGSWSGEHGDGIVRGGFNRRFFGERLYEVFREVKRLFDLELRMNPGKIIDTPPMESNLRYGKAYKPIAIQTRFNYREDGEIHAAVEQCSGVGECRKNMSGVMCPSVMLTGDELHSTRGRANILRLVLSGQLGLHALASEELRVVMDLCLSCKGCKGECPNSVDMARLKSEVLYHHHRRNGVPLRSRFFGNISALSALSAGAQAPVANLLMRNRLVRIALENLLGIDRDRMLPAFSSQSLSSWYKRRNRSASFAPEKKRKAPGPVVLFNDLYLEYNNPAIGRAAIEILEAAGYEVRLTPVSDSQRSALSLGLLDKAKEHGARLFRLLDMLSTGDVPVIVCEPSCASALIHDLPDFVDDADLAVRVASRVVTLEHFLEQELAMGRCSLDLKTSGNGAVHRFLVHGHCHQKTIEGDRWIHRLLARIPGAVVEDTEAVCCGMAGSFGFEAEHAELSRQIAAQRLLPRLAQASPDTQVVANGVSCRHQISDLSDRKPLHVAEVIRGFL